jgi:hypothetical protein
MVVDSQKIKTRSESWRYRVAGSMVRQAGSESRQARVKTGRTSKKHRKGKSRITDLT